MTDSNDQSVPEQVPLEQDRALVLDVLAGAITPESHPWVFDEDVLLFSVRRLERDDAGWLLARFADRVFPFDGRAAVFAQTRDVRDRALLMLREELPEFLR